MDAPTRLGWIKLDEEIGNAGVACRRCGISRPTLRKWWRRYQAQGTAGLEEQSRRPHRSPGRKVLEREEGLILQLRRERKLGLQRLRIELIRSHGLRLTLDTLHKVLVRHGLNRPPHGPKLKRKGTKRYSRPVPGDRVQLDPCKSAPGLDQYTAIDDCSRWQVLGVYPNRNAASTLDFLKRVRADMPFPVQRIQTDRGGEFYAYEVQCRLRDWRIKFRPNRPRAPHLNGKVERPNAPLSRSSGRPQASRPPSSQAGLRLGVASTTSTGHTPRSAARHPPSASKTLPGSSPHPRPCTPPTTPPRRSSAARTAGGYGEPLPARV